MKLPRYYPVVNGFKICKICLQNKELIENFQYHSPTKCYSGTCKECANKKRRCNHTLTLGRRENTRLIRQKICKNCGELKDINEINFTKLSKGYSKICNTCALIYREQRLKKRLMVGPLPPDTKQICQKCGNEKYIIDFYYSRATDKYSAWCKNCHSDYRHKKIKALTQEDKEEIKLQGINYRKQNRFVAIYNNYAKFDYLKNLENNLTKEFIKLELQKPCLYCGYPSTGLDRKDNSKGHTMDNCVPCCWECNTARMNNFSHEEMFILGEAIKTIKNNRK